jgi:hypothetical protein
MPAIPTAVFIVNFLRFEARMIVHCQEQIAMHGGILGFQGDAFAIVFNGLFQFTLRVC